MPKNKELSADIINSVVAENDTLSNVLSAGSHGIHRVTYGSADSYKYVGDIILGDSDYANEFVSTLINKIVKSYMIRNEFRNPLARLKKGAINEGDAVEEMVVELSQVHEYNSTEDREYPIQEIPDIKNEIHKINYTKYYKKTINRAMLRRAFYSNDGMEELVNAIIETMFVSAEVDEFIMQKYMLCMSLKYGFVVPVTYEISAEKEESYKNFLETARGAFSDMKYMSTTYNAIGLNSVTPEKRRVLIINNRFSSGLGVQALAYMFDNEKADIRAEDIIEINGFNAGDIKRLTGLLSDGSGNMLSEMPTEEDIRRFNATPAFLIDDRWFMIFDNLFEMTHFFNPEKLYWNYWLHKWNIFSVSRFVNAVAVTSLKTGATSITISPENATIARGQSITYTVEQTSDDSIVTGTPLLIAENDKIIVAGNKVTVPKTVEPGVYNIIASTRGVDVDGSQTVITATTNLTVQ
jgi:hypothetical protein